MSLEKYSIVILGDSVGKTSLIERYVYGQYDEGRNKTILADLYYKNITIDDNDIQNVIWDTAEKDRIGNALANLKHADAVILAYDPIREETLYNLINLKELAKQFSDAKTSFIVVGTKSDLGVSNPGADDIVNSIAEMHLSCSAKTGEGVQFLFETVNQAIAFKKLKPKQEISYAEKVRLEEKAKPNVAYPFIIPFVCEKLPEIIEHTLDMYSAQIREFNRLDGVDQAISLKKGQIIETQQALYDKIKEDLEQQDVKRFVLQPESMSSVKNGYIFVHPDKVNNASFCTIIPPMTVRGVNGQLYINKGLAVKISEENYNCKIEVLTENTLQEHLRKYKNAGKSNHF